MEFSTVDVSTVPLDSDDSELSSGPGLQVIAGLLTKWRVARVPKLGSVLGARPI